jgi:hypothetical protein
MKMGKINLWILRIFYFSLLVFIFPSVVLSAQIELSADTLRPRLEYKAAGLRDPFAAPRIETEGDLEEPKLVNPTEVNVALLPNLAVQGLIWGGSLPQAIINNKVVKAGDEIEGARIESISKDGVALSFADRTYSLNPPANSLLKPAAQPTEEDIFNREFQGGLDEEYF